MNARLWAFTTVLSIIHRRRKARGPRMVKVPKSRARRAGARRMQVLTRPQVKAVRVKGLTKCDICLGMIKEGLPSVLCECGKRFHNSCAMRLGTCPLCGKELAYVRQKPHVVDSQTPIIRPVPLSKEDKLLLLEERFLLGEVTERTYLSVRKQVAASPDTSLFCSVCGRRLMEGEECDCTTHERTVQCPECGSVITDEDMFCRKCGVVFTPEFSQDLFQCPECGRIVAEVEHTCECGVLLVGEGNMICPRCRSEIPESAMECPRCGQPLVDTVSECPVCGRRVDRDSFSCECGVVFSDQVAGIECSECGEKVELDDEFCPKCGALFSEAPQLEGKVERKVRK